MNMNKFLFASMILAGMTACSKEDVSLGNNEGGNHEMEGAAYMSLSISMPKANGSRATTDAGTEGEQKVSNLSVYIWDRNNQLITDKKGYPIIYHFNENDLRPSKPNNPSSPNNTTVYATAAIPVQKSDVYKVAVIVNGGKQNLNPQVTPDFLRKEFEVKDITAISTPNHFLMTNATTTISQTFTTSADKKSYTFSTVATSVPTQAEWGSDKNGTFFPDGTVGVNITGTKANPTSVVIPVERSVAKLEEKTAKEHGSLIFNLQNKNSNQQDKVEFKKVALVNANTKFFPVKNLAAVNGTDTNTQYTTENEAKIYVIDPNFANQKSNNDFLFTQFTPDEPAEKLIKWEEMAAAKTHNFYTLENTMIAAEQMNAYTTGFYYEAVYTLNGQTAGSNVYKYNGVLYTWKDLQEIKDLNLSGLGLTDNSSIQDFFDKAAVTKYEKGICYYPYWIRHINNTAESLAPMEFGVVRNNYYQMHVNSVKEIGFNKPENPDPNTPDEDPDTMLEVLVKVMPWTVRNNGIDF